MRSPSVFFLLAMAGTALSGCASGFDEAYVNSAASSATDTGGDGISGDTDSGAPNAVDLPGGDTAIAYSDGSRSTDGSGRAQLNISSDEKTATVAIDPGKNIGFGGQQTLANFVPPPTLPSPTAPNTMTGTNANYSEYRKITATTDSELQYWRFNTSNNTDPLNDPKYGYAAHYRDAKSGQDAWFFGGTDATDPTTITLLPTANYTGQYVFAATTSGWGDAESYQTADGQWRGNGTASLTADFGNARFGGTLTPQYWEKYENADTITVNPNTRDVTVNVTTTTALPGSLDIREFHTADITLNGTISGNKISGDPNNAVDIGSGQFVTGERALQGGFYGNNAEQITGVFATYGVLPNPSGSNIGINDDRRKTIDIQGVFHGQ